MSDCERFQLMIRDHVAGDLDESALGLLLTHCRSCDACGQLLALHQDLTDLGAHAPEPERSEFDALHARVLSTIERKEPAPHRQATRPPHAFFWPSLPSITRIGTALAAAIVLFAAGLYTGSGVFTPGVTDESSPILTGGMKKPLINAIHTEAASNRQLADVEDSRFTYSNVSFRRMAGDRVALDFDVATHVQLVEPMQSDLVREVLVHSLLNPSSTGARLKAMSFAAGSMEPKVRDALIFALKRDENLAVRIKALTILSEFVNEPEVEFAVLATLRDDDSVQMRLLALEYLAAGSTEQNHIRDVIREAVQPDDEVLRVRLAAYENKS